MIINKTGLIEDTSSDISNTSVMYPCDVNIINNDEIQIIEYLKRSIIDKTNYINIKDTNINNIINKLKKKNITNDDKINELITIKDNKHNFNWIIPSGSSISTFLFKTSDHPKLNTKSIKNFINDKLSEGYILKKSRKLNKANYIIIDYELCSFINNISINKDYSYYIKFDINNIKNKISNSANPSPYHYIKNTYNYNLPFSYLKPSFSENLLKSNQNLDDLYIKVNNIIELKKDLLKNDYISFVKGYDVYFNTSSYITEIQQLINLYKESNTNFKLVSSEIAIKIFSNYRTTMTFRDYEVLCRFKNMNNSLYKTTLENYNSNIPEVKYFKEKLRNDINLIVLRNIILEYKLKDDFKQDYLSELTKYCIKKLKDDPNIDNNNIEKYNLSIIDKDFKLDIYGRY